MYAVFDREVARAPPAIAFEGNGGHETHEKHLRDIKASRYGPNYACNQEATRDFEVFELRPTAPQQSTPDAQVWNGVASSCCACCASRRRLRQEPRQHYA
jgi:hypothetical protein